MTGSRIRVELLVVRDCANEQAAAELLRRALDEAGLDDVTFETSIVSTQEQAQARNFTGSPAFMLDGQDPLAATGAAPAVACRVYQTGHGRAGTPDQIDLVRAIRLKLADDPRRRP
ncbi:hypothetical protein ACOCJ7_10035 [Knoellia sp. CPCC 206453]|uniref:hypothetical protein n=1 Tax=Knoellia pratensis TaxID=3404796 RepID=UPI00360C3F3F